MPNYDYCCEKHGHFEIHCRLAEYDDKKPCPKCKKLSEQVYLPMNGTRGEFQVPVVIHVSSDGRVRFPGAADAKVPRGFEKREIRSVRELENFERQMNTRLRSEAEQHNEREERHFAAIHEKNRSELRQAMQHFSPLGRDLAMTAIRMNNERRRKSSEVGFHSVILNSDSSKQPWIDERTGWKRKYY